MWLTILNIDVNLLYCRSVDFFLFSFKFVLMLREDMMPPTTYMVVSTKFPIFITSSIHILLWYWRYEGILLPFIVSYLSRKIYVGLNSSQWFARLPNRLKSRLTKKEFSTIQMFLGTIDMSYMSYRDFNRLQGEYMFNHC